jgi:hypothetical protein
MDSKHVDCQKYIRFRLEHPPKTFYLTTKKVMDRMPACVESNSVKVACKMRAALDRSVGSAVLITKMEVLEWIHTDYARGSV